MSRQRQSNPTLRVVRSDVGDAPHCPHGPTVLFERHTCRKEEPDCFFACSASRDRKVCSFYQRISGRTTEKNSTGKTKYIGRDVCATHGQYSKRSSRFRSLPLGERTLCLTCGLLLMPEEQSTHSTHRLKQQVTDDALARPTGLLQPLVNSKSNAQYLFADRTVQFIINSAKRLGYKKLLCLGVPRLHEEVQAGHTDTGLSSLLMDIDSRLMQFYTPECFIRYNMFNNYFFGGDKSKNILRRFLLEDSGPVLLVTDPPFGGLAELLSTNIKALSELWRSTNDLESDNKLLPLLWFFPYFLEHKVTASLPELKMSDYKAEYDNHAKFKNKQTSTDEGARSKQGSVVRIFTNIDPATVLLPSQEGYRFCKPCQRYVSRENKHCMTCEACTSKDGTSYVHCGKCQRCVKQNKQHCDTCGFCVLPDKDPCKGSNTQVKGKGKTEISDDSVSTTKRKDPRKHPKRQKKLDKFTNSKKMKLSKN